MRFERPIDYFAEMIKTDQHMTKVSFSFSFFFEFLYWKKKSLI